MSDVECPIERLPEQKPSAMCGTLLPRALISFPLFTHSVEEAPMGQSPGTRRMDEWLALDPALVKIKGNCAPEKGRFSWAWWPKPVSPQTQEAQDRASQVQGLSELQSGFRISVGNLVNLCLKKEGGLGLWLSGGA